MKLHWLSSLGVLVVLAGCPDPVGDKPHAKVSDPVAPATQPSTPSAAPVPKGAARYVFSNEGSSIGFVGAKVTRKHEGGFRTFKGTVDVVDGKIDGTTLDVEIDMTSIYTDTDKLTGHLKTPDFFGVDEFPTARFRSTAITAGDGGTSTVTGNLTLHGVTKQISFPATIAVSGDTATAKAEFGLNRKDFGIVYPGSPDDLIKDEVLLKLDISAKRS